MNRESELLEQISARRRALADSAGHPATAQLLESLSPMAALPDRHARTDSLSTPIEGPLLMLRQTSQIGLAALCAGLYPAIVMSGASPLLEQQARVLRMTSDVEVAELALQFGDTELVQLGAAMLTAGFGRYGGRLRLAGLCAWASRRTALQQLLASCRADGYDPANAEQPDVIDWMIVGAMRAGRQMRDLVGDLLSQGYPPGPETMSLVFEIGDLASVETAIARASIAPMRARRLCAVSIVAAMRRPTPRVIEGWGKVANQMLPGAVDVATAIELTWQQARTPPQAIVQIIAAAKFGAADRELLAQRFRQLGPLADQIRSPLS